MKYGIIIGSHRSASESTKVGKYIAAELKKLDSKSSSTIIDLRDNPLPLWDESKWDPKGNLTKLWKPYSTKLKSCDAFVVISPEWAGMVPAGLKNFFLYCGNTEVGHKPAMIVTVSSGRGGHYPNAELRMSSYKNNHICYVPDHVVVSGVKDVLNDDKLDEENKGDFYIKQRIEYSLKMLGVYADAFVKIRKSEVIDYEKYPYGM
ncbi:NAD(P)H-dependent oxidoreductase [archaeon]|jgi:NAD(P)H-dependent FMN reductase|nr:NAD(P)H-dependent oxidoreductase [archaeon]MBT6762751.1 NAD(P)H-dependent oxidoreductase [archaeon]